MENGPNEVGKQKIKICIIEKRDFRSWGSLGRLGRADLRKIPWKSRYFPETRKKVFFFRFGPKIWRARNFEPGYLRAHKELGDKQDI